MLSFLSRGPADILRRGKEVQTKRRTQSRDAVTQAARNLSDSLIPRLLDNEQTVLLYRLRECLKKDGKLHTTRQAGARL